MYKSILLEKKDNIALITLNRPEKLNAVNLEMRMELTDLLYRLKSDDEAKAVIFTGAGRAFCAGADISEFGKTTSGSGEETVGIEDTVERLYRFEKPTIGAINGTAAGDGSQWVLSFDLNVAAQEAKFAWPATKLGFL